ncbi:ABC transporter ATP-binding protein/permease [Ochrobactrum sp. MYb379]|uniref:ABC transporter ATP-binding protein/permease n=1 Tax=Ochrobactrum sp. MYb379 TaxID=2745275 RepID=UPI0030B467D1
MNTLSAFVTLVLPFWKGRKATGLWLLLLVTLFFELAFVQVSIWINTWNKEFYDALTVFDGQLLKPLVLEYIAFIFLIVATIVLSSWFGKKLCFSWRNVMTQAFQKRWLHAHAHYKIRLGQEPDNPDQRIAEDIALLSEMSSRLIRNLVLNIARLSAFITVLWTLSGVQTVRLYSIDIQIHGYLVWIALAYSIIATTVMQLIGRKLQPLNIDRQHREADYRTTLLRVREYGEQIAFHRGEPAEIHRMDREFAHIQKNWKTLIFQELKLDSFSALQFRIAWFVPLVATMPLYLGKVITLGDMMQAQNAFTAVLAGFNWFLNNFKNISEWSAVVSRLDEFNKSLDTVDDRTPNPPADTKFKVSSQNLSIFTRDKRELLHHIQFEVHASQWLLLDGPSGVGKTALLRVFAGMWPYYSGGFELSENVMFLPQTTYIPHGNARHVISYPRLEPFEDEPIIAALNDVGLTHLISRLDEPWHNSLSGGERQRLAFARLILHAPDIAIADEPTSQLDIPSSLTLIRVLKRRCPEMTFIGTSHQPEIKQEFDGVVHLSHRIIYDKSEAA